MRIKQNTTQQFLPNLNYEKRALGIFLFWSKGRDGALYDIYIDDVIESTDIPNTTTGMLIALPDALTHEITLVIKATGNYTETKETLETYCNKQLIYPQNIVEGDNTQPDTITIKVDWDEHPVIANDPDFGIYDNWEVSIDFKLVDGNEGNNYGTSIDNSVSGISVTESNFGGYLATAEYVHVVVLKYATGAPYDEVLDTKYEFPTKKFAVYPKPRGIPSFQTTITTLAVMYMHLEWDDFTSNSEFEEYQIKIWRGDTTEPADTEYVIYPTHTMDVDTYLTSIGETFTSDYIYYIRVRAYFNPALYPHPHYIETLFTGQVGAFESPAVVGEGVALGEDIVSPGVTSS